MDEFALLDAVAQAQLVATRQVTPLELVDAAIARIERLDRKINAVVERQFEQARTRARGELPDGPFRGVPFLLKDLANGVEKGARHTCGSRLLKDNIAHYDSELVCRLRAAGLVFVGRSNTPEFGIPPITEPKLFGACHNPWNLAHSPGGSSGGAAAAVAARLVPFAHASDAGGSIRIPASCCGVFGFKPTRGRNPMGPRLGESVAGLATDHCCAISVRDSAALLDATCATDPGAPYAAPPRLRPFAEEIDAPHERLRIGVMRVPLNGAPVHAECLAALESAIALCRELGHEVREEHPTLLDAEGFREAFGKVYAVMAAANVDHAEALAGHLAHARDLEPITRRLAAMGRTLSAPQYIQATRTLHAASREIARFFLDHDVLLSPTLAQPPLAIGELRYPARDPLPGFIKASHYAAFTPLFNATGQPAMSVPLHWSEQGLPIGVQFAGRFGEDGVLFRLAAELERARPWAERLPPLLNL
ncbi:6-aminohexanoate-cyclic-dimer hydrolase [compost metagenome]